MCDMKYGSWPILCHRGIIWHQIMAFLGKANFCANGHSQLGWWCHGIQHDMLNVYHSPAHLFSSFTFIFSSVSNLVTASAEAEFSSLAIPCSECDYCYRCHPLIRPSIFRVLAYLCPWLAPGQDLCTLQKLQVVALVLHSTAFWISGKVVALQLDNSTVNAFYVIKVVQYKIFFPDLLNVY